MVKQFMMGHVADHNRHMDHRMAVPEVMHNVMVPYVDMMVNQFMMGHVADHNRHVDHRMVVPVVMVVPHVDMTVNQFVGMWHMVDHNMMVLAMSLMVMQHMDHRMAVPEVMHNVMAPYVDMMVKQFMMGHVADHNRHVDHRMVVPVVMVAPHADMTVNRFVVMWHMVDHNMMVLAMRLTVMQ